MAIADAVCVHLLLSYDNGPDEAAAELLEMIGDHAFDEASRR